MLTSKEREVIDVLTREGPKTALELSKLLECSVKRVKNLVGTIRRHGEIVIQTLDEDFNIVYLLPQNNCLDITASLKPKEYTYTRAKDTPYILYNIPEPEGDTIRLIPYGDLQYGLKSVDYPLINKMFAYIKDNENVYAIDGGDIIDNANKTSPGASVFEQIFTPQQSVDDMTRMQAEHAHKLLLKLSGNHEDRSFNTVYLDPARIISERIQVPHFPGQVLIDLVCGDNLWELYAYHGNSNSSNLSGRLNNLMKRSIYAPADIFLSFHVNDKSTGEDSRIIKDRKNMRLILKDRTFVLCGHATEYFNSYAEKNAYSPLSAGFRYIDFYVKGPNKGAWDPGRLRL